MNTERTNNQEQATTETTETAPETEGMETTVTQAMLTIPFPDSFIYSNVSALSASFMDIRVGFGEAMPDGTVQSRVGVVMPAEHAAQLVLNLLQNLAFFEHNFGEIRNPEWRAFQAKAKANLAAFRRAKKDQEEKA